MINVKESFTVANLAKGESCTYKIRANCGAPAFLMESGSTAGFNEVGISYIEFNRNKVITDSEGSSSSSAIADRYNMTFETGMPPRNQTF